MKRIIYILVFICSVFIVNGQSNPSGFPTQLSTGWFRQGWHQSDSGEIIATRTPNFTPRYPGTTILYQQNGVDTSLHYWTGGRWIKITTTGVDTTSLSNRINLKLNISDTASMLLPYLRKADTTNKWVQNVYARSDSLFKQKNGTETFVGKFSTTGAGTVTSVALSMPSAFTVTGSPITGSGTFGVSGAGTSLQYIRGNGTLATFDTAAIPDFYLKARGLLSATSPITYNSTTGVFGMADIVTAGACVNCNVTFDAKGRASAFSSGNPALVDNGVSISATGDTTQLGGPLTKYTFIRTKTNRSDPLATGMNALYIGNVPFDSSIFILHFQNNPGYDRGVLYAGRSFYNNDTLLRRYGGSIQVGTEVTYDSLNTKFKNISTPIYLGYGGVNSTSRLFPPDTAYIGTSPQGLSAGQAYNGELGIGGINKYNLTVMGNTPEYPVSGVRMGIDFARTNLFVKREIRGYGFTNYIADWKSDQQSISAGTTAIGSYINKVSEYMAYGTVYPHPESPSKVKTLSVSTVDTCIGFYAKPQWGATNEVKNGYGFVSEGTGDYNFFAGNTRFGGTMPSTSNVQTRRVLIDSTLQVGSTTLFGSTDMFHSEHWTRTGIIPSNFSSSPRRGLMVATENYFDQNVTSITSSGMTAVRGDMYLYADSLQAVSSNANGVGLTGAVFSLQLRKKDGYTDTTTFVGGTTARTAASALSSRLDMSSAGASGMPNLGTGYFASLAPNVQMSAFNIMDNAIWLNIGIGQFGSAASITNGYGIYINGFPSPQVTNKYAIYQEGTLDTVLIMGKFKVSNMTAAPATYNIVVHGDDSMFYQMPSSAFSATTIYNGDGSLAADRNIASAGFTLRLSGVNNSDTLLSIVNTGTSSTGLFSIGSLYGIDAQSSNVGLRAFGSSIGMTAEGGTSEGAIIKSDAIRGATIQSVPATTNTVQEVVRIERGVNGSPGADGIGGSANFYNKVSDNTSVMSNAIVSKFTTATVGTRVSQLSITGVNAAVTGTILTLDGDGTMTTAGKRIMSLVTSSAGTLTIGNAEAYVFNGTTTTWTLPAVSGTTGTIYYLKNIGSGTITLNSSGGGNDIYSTSAVNTLAITAGTSVILISNGTYFTTN